MTHGYMTETHLVDKNIYKHSLSAILIGQESHTAYKFNYFHIHHFIDNYKGHYGQNAMMLIFADGKPIAKLQFLIHYTINANGEWRAMVDDDYTIECLND
jgi:mannose/fructose/N-acetylgalactosamine-specific phosphotransferase system component IIB